MPAAQLLRITSLKATVYRRPTAKRLPHGLLPGACAKKKLFMSASPTREKQQTPRFQIPTPPFLLPTLLFGPLIQPYA